MTTPLEKPTKVLIAGCGLGGSFLALALARRGIRTEVFETRPSREDIGGAISLFPNASRCAEHIGIADKILSHGYKYTQMHMLGDDGSLIGTWPTGGGKLGHEACRIRRSDLHQLLLEELAATGLSQVQYDKHVADIKQDEKSVTVTFRDGSEATGDYLVGCDGIHSTVRRVLFGSKHDPEYQGVVSVGAEVPFDTLKAEHGLKLPCILYGQNGTVGIQPFGDPTKNEKVLGWFCTLEVAGDRDRSQWEEFRKSGQALKATQDRLKSWGPPVSELVAQAKNDSYSIWVQYKVPSPEKWYSGRSIIMGDAAHAIPPSAGQGAAQAFEDGELLARVLAEGGTFEAYQAERSKRISLITAMTKDSGDLRKTGSAGGFAFFIKKSFMKVYFHFFASGRGSAIYLYDSTEVPIR